MANEEGGIAQIANINQLPRTDGIASPPKDAVTNTSSFCHFEGGAEYAHG